MESDVLAVLRGDPRVASALDALAGRAGVWVVGGAVRDALLGRRPRDLDLVVEGDAVALAASLGKVVAEHERFGTAEALRGDLAIGVATARSETYAAPGALPDVTPATLAQDLARRDFTVNAVAVDLAGALHGFGAWREDLDAGRMRVLHERAFADDPTRLWRLARYAARLGFAVEPETERLARAAVADGALETVTGPRLGSELLLALEEPDPEAALVAAGELGLLPTGVAPRRALVREALAILGDGGAPGAVVLAAMAGGIDGKRMRAWLDDLGLPAAWRDLVVGAATEANALAAALADARRPSEVALAARGRAAEEIALAGALGGGDAARAWLGELRHVTLDIGGEDVLAAGVPQGPEVGERLARALAARLDGEAPDRAAQLAAALARLGR